MEFNDRDTLKSLSDAGKLYQHEMTVFRSFQQVPFLLYKQKRLEWLKEQEADFCEITRGPQTFNSSICRKF